MLDRAVLSVLGLFAGMPIPLAPAPKPKIEYDQADAADGGRSDRRPVSY